MNTFKLFNIVLIASTVRGGYQLPCAVTSCVYLDVIHAALLSDPRVVSVNDLNEQRDDFLFLKSVFDFHSVSNCIILEHTGDRRAYVGFLLATKKSHVSSGSKKEGALRPPPSCRPTADYAFTPLRSLLTARPTAGS